LQDAFIVGLIPQGVNSADAHISVAADATAGGPKWSH
jgi:hypothetical protein